MSGVKDDDDDDDDDTQPSAVAVVDDDDGGGGSGGGARDDRRRDDQHAVRVKPEYVLPEEEDRPPPPPTPTTDGGNGEGGGRDDDRRNDNDGDGDDGGKKKNRGMNKKRPRDVKIDYGEKACLSVVRGQPCPFLTMAGGMQVQSRFEGHAIESSGGHARGGGRGGLARGEMSLLDFEGVSRSFRSSAASSARLGVRWARRGGVWPISRW